MKRTQYKPKVHTNKDQNNDINSKNTRPEENQTEMFFLRMLRINCNTDLIVVNVLLIRPIFTKSLRLVYCRKTRRGGLPR